MWGEWDIFGRRDVYLRGQTETVRCRGADRVSVCAWDVVYCV